LTFFIEVCPESLYEKIKVKTVAKRVKTLKEIDASFLPIEGQVSHNYRQTKKVAKMMFGFPKGLFT